jgi:hypothetical protein
MRVPMKKFILWGFVLCSLLTGIVCAQSPAYGNWTEITNNASFGEKNFFGSTSFDDRLWVIGGTNSRAALTNDVWSSMDGKNWDLVTGEANFSPRAYFGITEFNHRLWVIGGLAGQDGYLNDVWSSEDGKIWNLVTNNANFSPRRNMAVKVFDNRLWVIGGATDKDGPNNDVWSSPDGKKWDLITDSANFTPHIYPGVAVFDDRLWVIGGAETNSVWATRDGKNWILVNASAQFRKTDFTPVVVFDNKLWIVESGLYPPFHSSKRGYYANSYDDVWSSPDGNIWTLESEHAEFGPRYLPAVTVFRNGIWVIGGEGSNAKDVWFMPSLRPEQTHVPEMSQTAAPATEPAVPKTTTAKSGSASMMACVSFCIAAGFCGWHVRRRLR